MTILRPKNFALVSAYITVQNIDKILPFYEKAFGFKLKEKVRGEDEDGSTVHAEMLYHDQVILFGKEGADGSKIKSPNSLNSESPISLYIYSNFVDNLYQQAITHGAESIMLPDDASWGDRVCKVKCPENYIWVFATYSGVCTQSK